ncbi:AAA family ATPase [Helicobacter sp. 16-1353]|uniref:ATP-binding protein n=1 Tax=Helicobacter sp. 16-1353 TaxID=2004996 RepID=UPI000DCBB888|nr:ATP-binding protein [Helicobacter sp. 16-1353]RAX53064.1 AAA family ATPase [Helicobacter sp. 16-1353]
MKYYIDFINSKNLSNNELAKSLNCSIQEAKILQYMSKALLNNQNNFLVTNIIENTFNAKGSESTKYLKYIKSLLNLEYISLANETHNDIMLLELLNAYISLSQSFLRILENGKVGFDLPTITAYKDDFDYIKDEFLKISLLQKLAFLRRSEKNNSKIYTETHSNLISIINCITKRLEITHKKLNITSFLKSYNLNKEEQIVFFALLKEEYYAQNERMREMGALLELISDDEYPKISNRYIFDEKSPLIENGLIDYEEDFLGFGGINRSFYIPANILQKIMQKTPRKSQKTLLDSMIKNQDIFELIVPKEHIENIILPSKTKETLDLLIQQLDTQVINRLKKWGIKDSKKGIDAKIIFYGYPGTGKTITAYALSNALKKPILSLDCSKILSMWVGESEKNVRKIFDTYKSITRDIKKDAILLLDEADQFLSQRSTLGNSSVDKMYNQMQNIFLEQIEKFDGILIATTNLLDNIDQAFSRRFSYKIEFLKPNFEQRIEIWKKLLPKDAVYEKGFNVDKLAVFETTGGQIKIIIKNTAYKVATKNKPIFSLEDFIAEIKKEMDSSFDGSKSLGFLK